jgi:hypothetical protein
MVRSLGTILMLSGIALMLVLGSWTLRAYSLYGDCVRLRTIDFHRSNEGQAGLEQAILGCSTHGMEIAGAGVVLGFVVFISGVVKSFLDKKSAEVIVKEGDQIMGDKKIEVTFGDGAVIHGDFVVANSIKNSFNKIDSAKLSEDLKKSLKELSVAVGKMSEKLNKGQAQEAARNLETLVSEAISEKPRRKWWELSIEGLKEAAINVGEVGKPVIEIATQVAVILGHMR